MLLLVGVFFYGFFGWGVIEKMINGVNILYVVYNSFVNKLFKVFVDNFFVIYNFDCFIKDEYKSCIIIGIWIKIVGVYSKFIMEFNNFDKMYNVVFEDVIVEFELDYKKQNVYVQEMMKENNIEWININQIVFILCVDLVKVGILKVDIYDVIVGFVKCVLFVIEDWKVE